MSASLNDSNIVVVRYALELTTLLLPLNNTSISQSHLTTIVAAVLQTLTKRDNSLSRRVYTWLLGDVQQNPPPSPQLVNGHRDTNSVEEGSSMYFSSFVYPRVESAIKSTFTCVDINVNSKKFNKGSHLVSHRILKALAERSEFHKVLLDLMPDYLMFLHHQTTQLNSYEKEQVPSTDAAQNKTNKKMSLLRNEIFLIANQYLCGLNRDLLWGWIKDSLVKDIEEASDSAIGDEMDRKQLVLILIQFLPQVHTTLHTVIPIADTLYNTNNFSVCFKNKDITE